MKDMTLLRMTRLMRGWTQAQFARRIRIDRTTVSRIETGAVNAGPALRQRIAKVLEMPEETLFPKEQ
jgi:transcriptional regulator with XRE-family HTH domain